MNTVLPGAPIDHIGLAVPDLESAAKIYQSAFGGQVEEPQEIASQNVILTFIHLQNTKIELLSPTSPSSNLQKFLDKRGPGLHHICYKVDDIEREMKALEKLGHKLIDKAPRIGAHNTLIAFLHPGTFEGVLIELCQTVK